MKNIILWNGIRDKAKEKGMTLMDVAAKSGVSYDMVKRYGNDYMPSAENLVEIAACLGTTAEALLKGE